MENQVDELQNLNM